MRLRIRQLPSKGPDEPVEFVTEKIFLRDGNQLECSPLRSGEVVEVPEEEAAALLQAVPQVLERTDAAATRDLVNEHWEPNILAANATQPAQSTDDMDDLRAQIQTLTAQVANVGSGNGSVSASARR